MAATPLHEGTASLLCAMPDARIEVVQELLGHADVRTTRGYVDVAAKAKVEAVNRLAAALFEGQLSALLQPNRATPPARD